MKTAEEWFLYFGENFLDGNNKFVNDELKHIKRLIKNIQLDAFKAGMTEAAEIAWNSSIHRTIQSLAGAIEAARDRKESL